MNDAIQWAIVAIALIASTIFMVRKLRQNARGKCDGCCERCKLHANPDTDCDDPKRNQI